MSRIIKYTVVVVLLLVGVVGGVKVYSALRAQKPAEVSKAAATGAPAEATLDLNEKQVAAIKVEQVGSATFVPQRKAVGNIDFNQNLLVQVFTPYQGRIIEAYPNIGDKVEKGQVLFTIDSPDLLAAESALIAAAGVLKLQNVTLVRAQKMKSFGGASQQAVDQSTSDQMTAEGALKSARDAVRIFGKTDAEIDDIVAKRKADPRLIIKSPVSGFVTARNAAPGLFVQPGAAPPSSSSTGAAAPLAIFTIGDLSTMWMFANVVESDAPLLRVGQKVSARVVAYPDREFEGKVVVLGQSVDPNSRRVFVRSEVIDPEHLLRAGMLANFTITVGERYSATAAPDPAIVREGDGAMTVWTTTDKRHFTRKTVKVGMDQNGFREIRDGLKPDELVVTDNAVFLSNAFALAGNSPD
jgi:cobalt-zinc-cadmium efflux system membrane fusion protein